MHCRIYGSHAINSILFQTNPIHITKIQLCKIHINIIILSTHVSGNSHFHSSSLTTILYGFLVSPTLRQSHSPCFSQLKHFSQRTSHKNISRNLRQLCNRQKYCIYSRSAGDFFSRLKHPMSTTASSQNILASRWVAEYWRQTKRRSYEVTQLEGVFCARQNKERSLQCKKLRGRQRKKVCGYWICDVCCCIVSRVNNVVPELKHRAVKTFGGNEEKRHAFLTSAREGGEWSTSFSGR